MNSLKHFSTEILITLISWLVSALIFLIKNYFSHLRNELKEVLQKVELIHIDVKWRKAIKTGIRITGMKKSRGCLLIVIL